MTTHESGVPPDGTEQPGGDECPAIQEPERSPVPWPLAALGLLVLLAVLLGFGLVVNALLRPQVLIAPQQTPMVVSQPAVVATLPPAAVLVTPVVPPPTPPRAVAAPTQDNMVVARTATLGEASQQNDPKGNQLLSRSEVSAPTVALGPTPTTIDATPAKAIATADPELIADISAAYQRYWQVRAKALLNLDSSELPQVMADGQLDAANRSLSELKDQGKAVYTDVDHNYRVAYVDDATAKVIDSYVDHSYYVKPGTDERLDESSVDSSDQTLSVLFSMEHLDETWKVVESVRSQ